MKYAIIQSGSRQFRAVEGATIDVEKLPVEAGDKVEINDVLLVAEDGKVTVGTPHVAGAKVSTTVVEQFRGPKIRIFKYKAKERYRRRAGHRQSYTRLKIEEIEGN
ncbi:MAG: 50S ribosomal protein L21 [Chloroflexi bacterium]|nr:50S ribosomal protein L21 [Chloroflexota bacterium]